jgi:hypothetical protein
VTNSKINPDIDTTSWPTQADLDPDVLYALIIGEPMLAYAISRFSSRKSAGVIPFIAACLLFFSTNMRSLWALGWADQSHPWSRWWV